MGVDRHLVATQNIQKGEYIASLYRAHNYTDKMTRFEILGCATSALINGECTASFIDWIFGEIEKRGACELIDTIVEDGCVEVVDE